MTIEEKLAKLQASIKEFEEARQRAGMQPVLHPALRQAVWDLLAEKGSRTLRIEAAELWKAQREFRKSLKAFTHAVGAGPAGYERMFFARTPWRSFIQDLVPSTTLRGNTLEIDYINSYNYSTPSFVQPGQLTTKPQRTSSQERYIAEVATLAVSEIFSTQAYRIYGETLVDFLTLQLSLDVESYLSEALATFISFSALPFNAVPYTGLIYQAISADVIHLLVMQEEEEQLYLSPRVRVPVDMLLVSQQYYNRVGLLKDLQARRLFADEADIVPDGVELIPVPTFTNPDLAVVARSGAFLVGYRDDLIVRVAPVTDFTDERNAMRITVEYDVAIGFVPRPNQSPLRGYARYSTLSTDAALITTTNYSNQ